MSLTERINEKDVVSFNKIVSNLVTYVFCSPFFFYYILNLFEKKEIGWSIVVTLFYLLMSYHFYVLLKKYYNSPSCKMMEINNHAVGLEHTILNMLTRMDESSLEKFSTELVDDYMAGKEYIPKNTLSLVCSYPQVYKVFRSIVIKKLEYLTEKQREEWGPYGQHLEMNSIVLKRRIIEDLFQDLEETNITENGIAKSKRTADFVTALNGISN